jgi:hypothetical protein
MHHTAVTVNAPLMTQTKYSAEKCNNGLTPYVDDTDKPESESESYVTTDGQSASLSWYKAPIRGLRPDFVSVRNKEYV